MYTLAYQSSSRFGAARFRAARRWHQMPNGASTSVRRSPRPRHPATNQVRAGRGNESLGVSLLCNHLCRRRYRPECSWGSVGLGAVGGPGCLRGICLRRRRCHLPAASTPRTKMIRPTLHSRQNDLLQVLNRQRALIERFVVKFLEVEGAALCRLIFLAQLPPLPYADEIRWQLR